MAVGLQPLLERRLPIVCERGIGGLIPRGRKEGSEAHRNERPGRIDATVEVHRRDKRLVAVGENGLLLATDRIDQRRRQMDLQSAAPRIADQR